jgi:hypothetical protein
MIGATVEQLVTELKTMPFTLLTVLSLMGFAGYAAANHADAGEIKQLSEKIDKNTQTINQVLTLQIAESLRNLQQQRCSIDDTNAQRTLSNTIEDLQSNYRRLTGSRYPLRECTN